MKNQVLRIENYFKAETRSRRNRLPGFTIVELLIVIVVIGILATISIVAYNGVQNRATDTVTKSDVAQAGKQLAIDKVMIGSYPASTGQANEGKGLAQSDSTRYMYTSDGESYELTGYGSRDNSKSYCISSTNKFVVEGVCPGHRPTDAGCFTLTPSNSTVTNYSDECPKFVIIPDKINGVKISKIEYRAFYDLELTGVVIPNSVTEISPQAFRGNKLTSIILPNSVTQVGQYAFADNQMSEVSLSESMDSIGHNLFDNNRLTSLVIPNSVKSIGYSAFRNNQLTSLTIGNAVTHIGQSSFADNQLTSAVIPNSVIDIGYDAFRRNKLTSLTIGSAVTNIGYTAFHGNSLSHVTIPNSVKSIGIDTFKNNLGINCRIPNSAPYDPLNPDIRCSTIERY